MLRKAFKKTRSIEENLAFYSSLFGIVIEFGGRFTEFKRPCLFCGQLTTLGTNVMKGDLSCSKCPTYGKSPLDSYLKYQLARIKRAANKIVPSRIRRY